MEQAERRPDLLTKFLTVAVLLGCAVFAQSSDVAIRAVLDRQVADWNRGDVAAFLTGYDDSDATLFIGSRVVRGYQRVLESFVSRYGSREKMGQLTFSNLEVHPLGAEFALVVGNFKLLRSAEAGGESGGIFTLTFQKKQSGWKIIADHTAEIAPPSK